MTKNTGFTLIEVLIALVVLSGGLLGLAALQATSLKNNQSAYNRSQATQLAYDLADRIRANAVEARLPANTYMSIAPIDAAAQENCTTTVGCAPAQMAQNDLFEWNAAVTATLPSGIGTIVFNGGIYTIAISWDDNRDGVIDANDPTFQTGFQLL